MGENLIRTLHLVNDPCDSMRGALDRRVAGLIVVLLAASPAGAADVGSLELRTAPRPAPAAYRYAPPPRYPLAARERGLEGVVVLSVLVRPDGRVDDATVAASSGAPVLDDAALNAVRTWLFTPATRGGRPVESIVEVPLRFTLRAP